VHEKLRDKQLALQTAVAQILRADGNSWARVAVGALVIVKDSKRRGYFLSLFSLLQQDSRPIWEEEIYDDMNIQLSRKFFLQFSGKDCQVCIVLIQLKFCLLLDFFEGLFSFRSGSISPMREKHKSRLTS